MPDVVVIVVTVFIVPLRVHHGPFWMMGIEPLYLVPMPPSGTMPVMTIVVCAPTGFSGASIITLAGIASIRLCESRRGDRESHYRTEQKKHPSQFGFQQFYFHRYAMR